MLVKRLTRRVAVMATDLGVEKYLVSAHSEVLDASFLPKIGDPPEQWWGKAGEAVDQQPELAADSRPGGAERVPGADQSADIDEDMKYKLSVMRMLYPWAIWIPGCNHILSSVCQELTKGLVHFERYLVHLRAIIAFFSMPWLLDRFIASCLRGTDGEQFEDLFGPTSVSLAEWRWYSLIFCVGYVLERMGPLRLFFDAAKMIFKEGESTDDKKLSTKQLSEASGVITKCAEAIRSRWFALGAFEVSDRRIHESMTHDWTRWSGDSAVGPSGIPCLPSLPPRFWAYSHALREASGAIMDLQIFMTSCICHPFRFQKWVDRTIGDENKHSIGGFKCIMRGRILPSLAAGEWKEVLRKISIRRSGRVLAHTVELEDEERAEVVDDFSLMKGRTSLMCEEKISAGYEALPPGLAVLVHPDERIARQHCPRIIDMLEHLMTQKTWDQVHPLIAYVHAKISELRKFALGEILRKDLNANMLRKLRRLALAQVNESPIEGRHGVANSRLRKRRKKITVSPVLFSTELRYPEFNRLLQDDGHTAVALQAFDECRTIPSIIDRFGLVNSPLLHHVCSKRNLRFNDVAMVFFHCDSETMYKRHKEQKKRLEQRRHEAQKRHKEKTPIEYALNLIDTEVKPYRRLLWKHAVDYGQTQLSKKDATGLFFSFKLHNGMNIETLQERRGLYSKVLEQVSVAASEQRSPVHEELDIGAGGDHGGGGVDSVEAESRLVPVEPGALSIFEVDCPSISFESKPLVKAVTALPIPGPKFAVARVVHARPRNIQRPLSEIQEPQSTQLAVTLHEVVGFDMDAQSISVALDASTLDDDCRSVILMQPAIGLGLIEFHKLALRWTRQSIQYCLSPEHVEGLDSNLVVELLDRFISSSAFDAEFDVCSVADTNAVTFPNDDANMMVLDHLQVLQDRGFVRKIRDVREATEWCLTLTGIRAIKPIARLSKPVKLYECKQEGIGDGKDLLSWHPYELMDYMMRTGWRFLHVEPRTKRATLPILNKDSPKQFFFRRNATNLSRVAMACHLQVHHGVLNAVLQPLETDKYYHKLMEPDKHALEDAKRGSVMTEVGIEIQQRRIRSRTKAIEDKQPSVVSGHGECSDRESKDQDESSDEKSDPNVTETSASGSSSSGSSSSSSSSSRSRSSSGKKKEGKPRQKKQEAPMESKPAGGGGSQPSLSRPNKPKMDPASFWWGDNGLAYFEYRPAVESKSRKAAWVVHCQCHAIGGERCSRERTLPAASDTFDGPASQLIIHSLKQWLVLPNILVAELLSIDAPNNKTEHMLVPTKVHEGNLFDESQLLGFANELLGEGAPGPPFRTRVTILSLGASRVSPGV